MSGVKRYQRIGSLIESSPQMLALYPESTVYVLASDYDRDTQDLRLQCGGMQMDLDELRTANQRLQADLDGEREAARDANADYLELQAANQRLEAQRDAILLQARCWAGEAKAQQSITREVGEILGGAPDWGQIADSVAAIVADRQRLEGEVARLRADAERWKAVETAGGELTLRLHNSRPDRRAAIIDAALRGNGGE
jgi:hypothetical protein